MKRVWILSYTHRHGEDISVYSSYKKAAAGAVDIMRQWEYELDERFDLEQSLRDEIHSLLLQGDYEKVSELWTQATDEELLIQDYEVQ
jgi:hypothetical protein